MRITPEFSFLAECCRWNFRSPDRASVAIPDHLDWTLFLRLTRFHRVQGLASRALTSVKHLVPEDIESPIARDSAKIAALNLIAVHECGRLVRSFESQGIPLLFLKGLTLGALAYGTSSAKSAADIDILVPDNSLESGGRLLLSLGYRLADPEHGDLERLGRWHRAHKESLWANQATPIRIDFHTRVSDNSLLIPSIGIRSPRQIVDVGNGLALPTLADDELFAYLAVHGSSSAWFRLKWAADFAALLAPLGSAEIERRYRRALELGAGRAAAQALLLVDVLFASLADNQDLRAELRRDAVARLLCRAALKQLAGRREPAEPTAIPLGTATIHWSQLFLLQGFGSKLSEVARQARAALANRS